MLAAVHSHRWPDCAASPRGALARILRPSTELFRLLSFGVPRGPRRIAPTQAAVVADHEALEEQYGHCHPSSSPRIQAESHAASWPAGSSSRGRRWARSGRRAGGQRPARAVDWRWRLGWAADDLGPPVPGAAKPPGAAGAREAAARRGPGSGPAAARRGLGGGARQHVIVALRHLRHWLRVVALVTAVGIWQGSCLLGRLTLELLGTVTRRVVLALAGDGYRSFAPTTRVGTLRPRGRVGGGGLLGLLAAAVPLAAFGDRPQPGAGVAGQVQSAVVRRAADIPGPTSRRRC